MVQQLGNNLHHSSVDKDKSATHYYDTPDSIIIQNVSIGEINEEIGRWFDILSPRFNNLIPSFSK